MKVFRLPHPSPSNILELVKDMKMIGATVAVEFPAVNEPDALVDAVVLYGELNGSGKMELRAKGPTGAPAVLFTEP